MANQQIFPQSSYPGAGDISTTPGNPSTTVVGLQNQPVASTQPQTQQILVYGSDGVWHPEDPIVSGPDAVGTSPSVNPVQVAGIDDGTLVREVRTDAYGGIQLSAFDRELLRQILNQLKALTRAIVNLDSTNSDPDYAADQFDNVDPMQ